jgi:hypothetical protein
MKIYKGRVDWTDSFQELVDCWVQAGYCESAVSEDRFSWAFIDRNNAWDDQMILLHEHDQVTDLPSCYKAGLFANAQHKTGKPWVYWPRHIKHVTQLLKGGVPSYEDRPVNSLFVGAVENPVQYVNRTKFDWSLAVDSFDLNISLFSKKPHKHSNLEFLKLIRGARFGLSLEGYGPKCQRDIEYIANGVVPVFTWKGFNDYHNPLVENVHYLTARHPREAKQKIKQTTKAKWEEMSSNCVEWFNKNCSIEGSFKTTMEAINE